MADQSKQTEMTLPCPHCSGSGKMQLIRPPASYFARPKWRTASHRWRRLFSNIALIAMISGGAILYVSGPPASTSSKPPSVPQFVGTEQPLPASGKAWFCQFGRSSCWALGELSGERSAPFEIRTVTGQNYLLKLARPSKDYLLIFVRGGPPVTVNMPLGAYTLTYAVGSRWYGQRSDKKFFGRGTAYLKADDTFSLSPETAWAAVTLYPVARVNTRSISPVEF
jgi:hypothetical protein